ncbi:MAG TPA: hypothetical protein VH022_09545 [Candidatus Acidoferrum sp.]|nr:hypothetical protein [Candidatus Acidoferrum sp.]
MGDAAVKMTTLNLSMAAPPRPSGPRPEQWDETRSVFPIYVALAKQLTLEIPFAADKRILPEKADAELYSRIQTWLDSMDQQVLVYQLRHLLQMTTLNASEAGLRALIQRHLRKPSKSNMDRDKSDFLLVQYFALCAPPKVYHKQIELEDVAQVMKPVLGETSTSPISWSEPLEKMIVALRGFRSLRDMLKTSFVEQGRKVKDDAGKMFYEPASLVAFVRFNFLLRRTLIELMHADLIAIRSGLSQLDSLDVQTVDCRLFGLSQMEPLTRVRQLADEWKQPFQQEYTERTVNEAFEKLLCLRTDVEKVLEKVSPKAAEAISQTQQPSAVRESEPAATAALARPVVKEAAKNGETLNVLDFEACLEQIWEQLIAVPPARGRSMTTVKIGNARILMSSWEVTAFVSEDSPSAEDLRRAVVARAIVTAATESARESGNATSLERALSIARVEVSRLQERVDIAKQAKDTEAAVNLGISTKRLLSALDEAEKL